MTALAIQHSNPKITIVDGNAVTTSVAIAEYFHKRHADVLRKIDTLECSPEFVSAHFCVHAENIKAGAVNRESKYYQITRDGFAFLAMGFTGKKAAKFKEDYISEFNRMESELQKPAQVMPLDYEFLTVVRGGKVFAQRFASPDELFLTFDSFKEMAGRLGYLIIHGDDVKKLTIDEFLKLGSTQSKVAKISSR